MMKCLKGVMAYFLAVLTAVSVLVCVPAASAQSLPVWDGTVAQEYAGGDGTEENPYLISNGSELALLMQQINSSVTESERVTKGNYYKITADIILNDLADFNTWSTSAPKNEWTPGGKVVNYTIKAFSGHLDGGNYDIKGIYINSDSQYNGLFGYIDNGVVENLNITNAYISGKQYTAGVTGYLRAHSASVSITNCSVSDSVVSGSSSVGGIVGYAEAYMGKVLLEKCSNGASVSSKYNYAGGIAGAVVAFGMTYIDGAENPNYAATIKDCINNGDIKGNVGVGGIIGTSKDFVTPLNGSSKIALLIKGCVNTGKISSTDTHKGVIAGTLGPADREDKGVVIKIVDCYSAEGKGADGLYGFTLADAKVENSDFLDSDSMKNSESFNNYLFGGTWYFAQDGAAPSLKKLGDTFGTGKITAREFIATLGLAVGTVDKSSVKIGNIDFDEDGVHSLLDINAFINYLRGKGASNG